MFLGLFFMIFIAFLFVFAIGSSILRGIFGLIFAFVHRIFGTKEQSSQYTQQQTHQSRQNTAKENGEKGGKIFDKSDGEYVDFEEIKD